MLTRFYRRLRGLGAAFAVGLKVALPFLFLYRLFS
jgi:hypothetical protein